MITVFHLFGETRKENSLKALCFYFFRHLNEVARAAGAIKEFQMIENTFAYGNE